MPEAPVDEDGDALPGKGHVCASPQPGDHRIVDAEAQPASVQVRPQGKLTRRVALTGCLHPPANLLRRRRRHTRITRRSG
jgi:hypothetical protein